MSANSETLIPFNKQMARGGSFVAEHSHHPDHKNPSLLLLGDNFEHYNPLSLSLLNHKMDTLAVLSAPFRHDWKIIDSCHGLLCVEVFHDRGDRLFSSLWLWNPVTRELRKVSDTLIDVSYVCSVGFGFSSVANDYKIARFYYQNLNITRREEDQYLRFIKHDRVEVFSLSTGSWKVLESEALQRTEVVSHDLGPAFSADGFICWNGYQRPFSTLFISFDMAREVFTIIPKPTERDIFGVYQNKLAGEVLIKEGPGSHSILVLMSENGSSCAQEYRIGPKSDFLRPACIWGNEVVCRDSKEDEVKGDRNRVLHMFNFITNEQRRFNYSIDRDWIDVYNYEESLVSVWNTQVE